MTKLNFYDEIERTLYHWIENKVGRRGQSQKRPCRNDYKLKSLKRIKNEMNNLTNDKLSVMIPSWTRRLESLKSPISKTVMSDLAKFETLIRKEIKDRTRRMQENRIESFIEDLNLREFYDEKKFNDNIRESSMSSWNHLTIR